MKFSENFLLWTILLPIIIMALSAIAGNVMSLTDSLILMYIGQMGSGILDAIENNKNNGSKR